MSESSSYYVEWVTEQEGDELVVRPRKYVPQPGDGVAFDGPPSCRNFPCVTVPLEVRRELPK